MPKPKGRPRGSRNEPPVSLSPLSPEEALAGLMQVKPEEKTEDVEATEEEKGKEKPKEQHGR